MTDGRWPWIPQIPATSTTGPRPDFSCYSDAAIASTIRDFETGQELPYPPARSGCRSRSRCSDMREIHDKAIKQPRVGDRIATGRYGNVTVRAVHSRGIDLEVTDRLGREWDISRAKSGHWLRLYTRP